MAEQIFGFICDDVQERRLRAPASSLGLTATQLSGLVAVQAAGGGAIPLSKEEFDALLDGNSRRVLTLGRSPESSLYPCFCWGEAEHGEGD